MKLSALLLFLCGAFLVEDAHAQPVNAEILRRDRLEPGWSFETRGSIALRSGNVELFDLGLGMQVQLLSLHERDDDDDWVLHRVFVRGDARQADRAGDRFINNAFTHARWTAMWLPRVGSEVFAQLQFNEFLRLNTRALGGVGARVEILHAKDYSLAFGSAVMPEYEFIEVESAAQDAPETFTVRWSNYMSGRFSLVGGTLLAQGTVYVQPRFDAPQDLRILQDYEVAVRITEYVSFGTSLLLLYDSRPPTGIKANDVRLSSDIRLAF